jgi:hypothetical protein
MKVHFEKRIDRNTEWSICTNSSIIGRTDYSFTTEQYELIKDKLSKLFSYAKFHFSYVVDKNWGHIHIEFESEADEAQFLLMASYGVII